MSLSSPTTAGLVQSVRVFSKEFTLQKTRTGVYARRHQTDAAKIELDCYYGKLAEWAAFFWLCDRFPLVPVSPPSMAILFAHECNWEADLFSKNKDYCFAVKNCPLRSSKRFGRSWTFQAGMGRDPILDSRNPNHKVIFVENVSETCYNVYGVSDARRLGESGVYLFEDGVDLPHLKGIKLFVKANKTPPGVIQRVGWMIDFR